MAFQKGSCQNTVTVTEDASLSEGMKTLSIDDSHRLQRDPAASYSKSYEPVKSSDSSLKSTKSTRASIYSNWRTQRGPLTVTENPRAGGYSRAPRQVSNVGRYPITLPSIVEGQPCHSKAPTFSMVDCGGETPRKVPRSVIRIGLIIRAPLHEAHFDETASNAKDNKNTTDSCHGPIYTKIRKMIVVACHASHYIAVPLFTYNGTGLANKRNKAEYISVQDHRNTGPFQELSSHGRLKTKYLGEDVYRFDVKSTAHFTYPLSRKYDLPVVVEGYIEESGTKLLARLVRQYINERPSC